MFVLIWAALLFSVRGRNAGTGASPGLKPCKKDFCITLNEGEIQAEAGLCVVIPCSFTPMSDHKAQIMTWFKCEPSKQKCANFDMIFHTNENKTVRPEFKGRVSLLEPDLRQNNCSIIINDLTQSDSGSYHFRVKGFLNNTTNGFTAYLRTNVSVEDLIQKPTVVIPPLIEGQQTTLTCTAPGLCSGSDPTITWMWSGRRKKGSHITGNITEFKTENVTSVTRRHSSTLTFDASDEHNGTDGTCKVSFINNISTEKMVTLNVTSDQPGPGAVLPWVVAALSLIVNVIFIICLGFLWNTRKKVKPNQEDRSYMSLRKKDLSTEYDVIGQPLN